MIRDNDHIFERTGYDTMLKNIGVTAIHTPLYSPMANSFAESHIGKIKQECLNHFACFSSSQLDYIVNEWRKHYQEHRPHQGKDIGNKPLDKAFVPQAEGWVKCASALGGLLKAYYRDAA